MILTEFFFFFFSGGGKFWISFNTRLRVWYGTLSQPCKLTGTFELSISFARFLRRTSFASRRRNRIWISATREYTKEKGKRSFCEIRHNTVQIKLGVMLFTPMTSGFSLFYLYSIRSRIINQHPKPLVLQLWKCLGEGWSVFCSLNNFTPLNKVLSRHLSCFAVCLRFVPVTGWVTFSPRF